MGHEDRYKARVAAASCRRRVVLEERVFCFRIERSGRFVEHQQQRTVAHKAASERQFLPLTEADFNTPGPPLAKLRLQAGGQTGDDVIGAGAFDGGGNSRLVVEPW